MLSPFIYKYQPIYLKDFEISDDLRNLLHSLINMDMLNIILIGNSGSGKSSLIQAILKEYYGNNNYNNDVLHINSLKEQGISYYRGDTKTFCQTASSIPGKKKVLVLDDLDIINEQSQQAFRNYIDKYSQNVHFIASCSKMQKIIDSIQSRMMIVKIKLLEKENLIRITEKICRSEDIVLDDNAKDFIIQISNNSVRILINYLEKIKLINKKITLELVQEACTNIYYIDYARYIKYCKNKNLREAINIFYSIYDKGYSVMDILDSFFLFIKVYPELTDDEKYNIIPLLCKYITIFNDIHENVIELALFTNNLITYFSKDTIK
tara:strand:- start:14 stop:979 length:966 start_codon:yes stop_codon:yes gene_type:complete